MKTTKNINRKALCDEICTLLGYKTWEIKKVACTGDWAGCYDYSLKFDDGKELYICTSIDTFEINISEMIAGFKRTSKEGFKRGDMVKMKKSGTVARVASVGSEIEGYGTMLYLMDETQGPQDRRFVEYYNIICTSKTVTKIDNEPTL